MSNKADKTIPVIEMFGPTVQGEGLVIGWRTVFIRFGLCDYACKMCDSMHAVDPIRVKANATWMTQQEIFDAVLPSLRDGNCRNVTFSGGNPCIHDLTILVGLLIGAGISISVETQGTKDPKWLDSCHYITCSPKGPGMGEKFSEEDFDHFINNHWRHQGFSIKIVIFDVRDLEFAAALAETNDMMVRSGRFFLSLGNPRPPGHDDGYDVDSLAHMLINQYEQLFDEIKDYPSLATVKFLPQMHVLMYGNKQGV